MFPTNGLKVKKEENKNLNKTVPILRKGYRPENADDDSDEEINNKNVKDKKINNEIDEDEEIKRLKNKLKELENKKNQIKNNNNISEIIKNISKEKESINEIEYEEQIININDIIQNEKEEEKNLLKEKNEIEQNKTKKIMSKREKDLLKKYVENNSSEEESEENEEEEEESIPIFISSNARNKTKEVNNNINNEDIEDENEKIIKRKKEDNINNLIKQEKEKKSNNKEKDIKKENNDLLNMPDDTDNPDDQIEYENWKIRELNRIKRQMEEKEIKKKEQKEIERRRNLTDEQRKEENLKLGSDSTIRNFKSKIKYLQKYYHKGAFFQDEAYNNSEHIYNRDFNLPTWEDSIDRSNVPAIMEKRRGNLFKKGQSKYTHLTNEDTTNFDPDFRIPDNINNNILKKIGGYKGQNKFDGK